MTASKKSRSWLITIKVPSYRLSQSSNHTKASKSRWLVGSSSSIKSAGHIRARLSCKRMRQPPEKLLTGLSSSSLLKPKPSNMACARERAVCPPASSKAACAKAMASPSSRSSAWCNSASTRPKRKSPSNTKSVAPWSVSGMCCSTCEISQLSGMNHSPWSSWSCLVISANKLDFPAPLRPINPTFSPTWMVAVACERTTLVPRRSTIFLKFNMGLVSVVVGPATTLGRLLRWCSAQWAKAMEKPHRNGRARGQFPAPTPHGGSGVGGHQRARAE